jgi:hypothetical protein
MHVEPAIKPCVCDIIYIFIVLPRLLKWCACCVLQGWLGEVHLHSGVVMRPWVSSLAAFWPGLQALIGKILVFHY